MDTIHINEMFARFMYLRFDEEMDEYYFPVFNSGDWHSPSELCFHASWDWLMPLIKEITNHSYHSDEIAEIHRKLATLNMEETYKACVDAVNKINKFFQS